jgi:hypothetical protein
VARFYGVIGFSVTNSTVPGVWTPSITERPYKGEVISNFRKYESNSDSTNDDILLNNKISVLSDSFIDKNIGNMIFVVWNQTAWKISNVEITYPRIIITLGGVYHGDRAS